MSQKRQLITAPVQEVPQRRTETTTEQTESIADTHAAAMDTSVGEGAKLRDTPTPRPLWSH